jgi:kynurenine formamidase
MRSRPLQQHPSENRQDISMGDVLALARKYRTWGRWGFDDEVGALNYVTPDAIAAGARCVIRGHVFSLALPFDSQGPQTGAFGRTNPIHLMLQDGGDIAMGAQDHLKQLRYTDDAVYMPLQCGTQWDAFAHVFHDGHSYNGCGPEVVSSAGAVRNSITPLKDRMVGRGVLLDIARWKGKRWLAGGEAIQADDLSACAKTEGVEVRQGDFVLVRTGRLAAVRKSGTWDAYASGPTPGLAVSSADFLCPRRVAAVATDTFCVEVMPNETPDVFQPLHIVLLVNAGIVLGEMFDLEELAADCAEDGIYEFLFAAPPLPITGAVGSPINPQAVK